MTVKCCICGKFCIPAVEEQHITDQRVIYAWCDDCFLEEFPHYKKTKD